MDNFLFSSIDFGHPEKIFDADVDIMTLDANNVVFSVGSRINDAELSSNRYILGKYNYGGERIRLLFSVDTVLDDNYETYVLEQHINNHYNST